MAVVSFKPKAYQRKVASINPKKMVPPFDVIEEMTNNREDYAGEEWLSLLAVPDYIRASIARIRARVPVPRKPGVSPVFCCCIGFGVKVMSEHESIRGLLSLKDDLFLTDDAPSDDIDEVISWFGSFNLSVPNPSMSKLTRVNLRIPSDIKIDLSHLAGELSLSNSTLGTIAAIITLSIQTVLLPTHKEILENATALFFRLIERRKKLAETLIASLGASSI